MHIEPKYLNKGISVLNDDINNIANWAKSNNLILNSAKTKAMIMGTVRCINRIDCELLPQLVVNDVAVPYVDSAVYLGIATTRTLSWDVQISCTVNKMHAALYQLKTCKQLLPMTLRARLVTALIFPYIDYCSAIFSDLTGELNIKLQRALNACIRFIFYVKRDEHITPYYDKLRWLKVANRRDYFTGSLLYAILHSGRHEFLFRSFRHTNNISARNTRADHDALMLLQCRTEVYKRSFCCYAARFWNGLPSEIRNADSIDLFRIKLYDYLLAYD